MTYVLSTNNRVDFKAYAPLHTFTGWLVGGLQSEVEIDFETLSITRLEATADTMAFATGDKERTRAMRDYFSFASHPQATFVMTECRQFIRIAEDVFQVTLVGVLGISGIQRQLPLHCRTIRNGELVVFDLNFKWSFKAYGLKAPRLFFLNLKDVVDIQTHLEFIPEAPKNDEPISE